MIYKTIIIGGGPAGVMTGMQINNEQTLLIEQNDQLLLKLMHSGGGRCNITNNDDTTEFMSNIINHKFFISSWNKFTNKDSKDYIESIGVKLKLENNKYFPTSNESRTIIEALQNKIKFKVKLNTKVESITSIDNTFKVITNSSTYHAHNVVIATGGITHQCFNATDFGLKIAKQFDHNIVEPYPTNVALKTNKHNLMGTSLNDVYVTYNKKRIKADMLFTHFGVTGPAIFKLTGNKKYSGMLSIDVVGKPEQEVIDWLKRSCNSSNKTLINIIKNIAPAKYLNYILKELANLVGNSINKEQYKKIAQLLVNYQVEIVGHVGIDKAFTMGGGINTKEINPKNFESKKVPNLFFIGELLDYFAPTGGYNLTLCFSMGYSCGQWLASK